ncbi:DUF4190 domain-containing protein [Propionibacteriaceae bacterium Y1685]|uniref:DUF4190 domain-containing protein n=1 Tax=Microlunatus sp. Y1700 TaxID=3418487 RepID=UPI003B7BF897
MSEPHGYGPDLNQNQYGSQQYGQGQHNPYGQQNPYGVQASPYGMTAVHTHPQSTTILILGILSVTVFALCGPFAWSMGNKALKEIDSNPGAYSDRGQVVAGRIMGIIGTVLLGLAAVFMIIYVIFIVIMLGVVAAS